MASATTSEGTSAAVRTSSAHRMEPHSATSSDGRCFSLLAKNCFCSPSLTIFASFPIASSQLLIRLS